MFPNLNGRSQFASLGFATGHGSLAIAARTKTGDLREDGCGRAFHDDIADPRVDQATAFAKRVSEVLGLAAFGRGFSVMEVRFH
jgi:hypothetical protein